jgi:hypothetical protein
MDRDVRQTATAYFDAALLFEELEPIVPCELIAPPDPVVVEFIASNTDIPWGPIVITIGLPSFVLAWTTKDSATTLMSVKPAFCKSSLIFSAAVAWPVVDGLCELVVDCTLLVELVPV